MIEFHENESSNSVDAIFPFVRAQLWGVKNEDQVYEPEKYDYDSTKIDIKNFGGFEGNFYPLKRWRKQFLLRPVVTTKTETFMSHPVVWKCEVHLLSCSLKFWYFIKSDKF
jgi:hypothetical protein